MRTPDGIECKYFFGDYYRGRDRESCRLLEEKGSAEHWTSALCRTCPVPGILRANACESMTLSARITSAPLGIKRQVKVKAYCHRAEKVVKEPKIGCGLCHPIPPEWK